MAQVTVKNGNLDGAIKRYKQKLARSGVLLKQRSMMLMINQE